MSELNTTQILWSAVYVAKFCNQVSFKWAAIGAILNVELWIDFNIQNISLASNSAPHYDDHIFNCLVASTLLTNGILWNDLIEVDTFLNKALFDFVLVKIFCWLLSVRWDSHGIEIYPALVFTFMFLSRSLGSAIIILYSQKYSTKKSEKKSEKQYVFWNLLRIPL